MNAIGGYFGLELRADTAYHAGAVELNTGRNALEYILKAKKYRKIFLPRYTCHVLLQPIRKLGIDVGYYSIDAQLEPIFDFSEVKPCEAFLYTNYFGLKDDYILRLKDRAKALIIDNAQAFYAQPLPGTETFYSARKFFGVPDGAYLYTDTFLEEPLEQDFSFGRCAHLLVRVDKDAENGYPLFTENDEALDHQPIRSMSQLTRALLGSIDYTGAAAIRQRNFRYLHDALITRNSMDIPLNSDAIPMVYPFLASNPTLRAQLIRSRIYVARYWSEVLELSEPESIEHRLAADLIPLPIDQKLSITDLDFIIKTVKYAH